MTVENFGNEQAQATNILAMAQKLYNEYVDKANVEAQKIIDEARNNASLIERDASQREAAYVSSLQAKYADLEKRINDLQLFETTYRETLRTQLVSLLDTIVPSAPQPENTSIVVEPAISPLETATPEKIVVEELSFPEVINPSAPVQAPLKGLENIPDFLASDKTVNWSIQN